MKRSRQEGLTFLELVIAMSIAFVAVTFVLGVMINATRHHRKAKELSSSTFLAQSTMEKFLTVPMGQLPMGGPFNFSGEFSEFLYSVDANAAGDFDDDGQNDPELTILTLTVTSPAGNEIAFTALRQEDPPFYGTAPLSWDRAYFTVDCDDKAQYWQDATGNANAVFGSVPGHGGDMVADNADTELWVVDRAGTGIRSMNLASPVGWSDIRRPNQMQRPVGITANPDCDLIFVSDSNARCLWRYNVASDVWDGPYTPSNPLLFPKGIAMDNNGIIWIADRDAKVLRRFDSNSLTWDSTTYAYPGGMGPLEGAAVSPDGKTVHATDSTYFYTYDVVTSTWTLREFMDGKIRSDYPCAMEVDESNTYVWLTTRAGSYWKFKPSTGQWWEIWYP